VQGSLFALFGGRGNKITTKQENAKKKHLFINKINKEEIK